MVNKRRKHMYNYSESIKILTTKFPILKAAYEDDIEYYEDLPYVFYEDVFIKHIMDKTQSNDEVELRNIFNFVEDMLFNGDDEIKNLIGVAVVESLYYENDFAWNDKSLSKMYGALTKKSFEDCAS